MRRFLTFALAFFLPATLAGAQQATPLGALSRSFESLVAKVSPAVVEVFVTGYGPAEDKENDPTAPIARESSLGSGVIVDPDGYIITNYHVVKGAQRVSVLLTPPLPESQPSQVTAALRPQPQSLPATILGFDKAADLAVLKVDATGLPTVPFAPYLGIHQGELVLAIGSPEGLQNSVSMGLVSSVLRRVDPDSLMVFIQTDAAINPGNSGGALVDMQGDLVGINSSILTQSGGNEGIGFAIPSGIVRFVYQQIRKDGRVRRGEIGARVQTITPELAAALNLPTQDGVIVSDVAAGGPAEAAGLKVSDLIQTINGIPTPNASAFIMDMYTLRIGSRARVGVLRGNRKLTLDIPVIERKQSVANLADLIHPKQDAVPEIGIFGVDLTPDLADLLEARDAQSGVQSGVIVAGTTADRASEVGLKVADIIHSVNGKPIANLAELRSALSRLKPGDPAALQVERDGRLMFLTFEVD